MFRVAQWVNSFQPSVAFRIETIRLICNTNQMTGFYMKCNTGLKQVQALHQNQKVASSNPTGHSARPSDPTLLLSNGKRRIPPQLVDSSIFFPQLLEIIWIFVLISIYQSKVEKNFLCLFVGKCQSMINRYYVLCQRSYA